MCDVRIIEKVAELCHRLRYSGRARIGLIVVVLTAFAAVLFSRPEQMVQLTVSDVLISSVDAAAVNRYVRVSGMFRPDETFKRYLRLNEILGKGFGPGFAPLVDPSSGAVLWVLDDGLPAPEANAPVTFIGRVTLDGSEAPVYYLVVGAPPAVRIAQWLASLGVAMLIGAGLAVLLIAAAARWHFALPSLWRASDEVAPDSDATLSYYGALGYAFDNVQLRAAPVRLAVGVHEVCLTPFDAAGASWSVVVRRVMSVDLFDVATRAGARAAMRLQFEDDHGLLHSVVLAAPSRRARGRVMELFVNLRL